MKKQSLSLQFQFLLIPLLMVILAASLLYSRSVVNSSQRESLRTIEKETFPPSIELTQVIIQLTQILRDCDVYLVSVQSQHDKESVYLRGQVIISQLQRIEKRVDRVIKEHGNPVFTKPFHDLFLTYKGQIITAIEMATVDLKLARSDLIRAHEVINKIDKNVEQWVISTALKTSVNQVLTQLENERIALQVSFLGLALLAIGGYVLARHFTRVITLLDTQQKNRIIKNTALSHSLEAILASSYDAVICFAPADGVIESYNPAAVDLFGFTEDEAIGVKMSELIIAEKFWAKFRSAGDRYLQSGESNLGMDIE